MQDAWIRVQRLPGSVRAGTVGIALIALAVGAWVLAPGHEERRVPVAPILQSETTAGNPAPVVGTDTATDTTTNTVVSVTEAGGEGSQFTDVSSASSASAPPGDVSAEASVDQSSTQTNDGTGSTTANESTSQHYSSTTTSSDGSTSTSVEINKTSSNEVVTSGPDQDGATTSHVVTHVSSNVGSTAG